MKGYSGKGTAKDIVKVVKDFLEKEKLSEQLVAGVFDGQYFHNGVHRYLTDLLKLKKIHVYTHDFAHRMQFAEKDSRDAGTKLDGKTQYYQEFVNKAIKLISDVLSDIRFGKSLKVRILKAMERCPEGQFYKARQL